MDITKNEMLMGVNYEWFPLLLIDDEGTEWTPAPQALVCEFRGRPALFEGRKLDGSIRFIFIDSLSIIGLRDAMSEHIGAADRA